MLSELADEYKTGIPEIDKQHKKWIEMYSHLNQLLNHSKSVIDSDQVTKILKDLYDYTSYHFKYEEKLMVEIEYPDVSGHRRTHKSMDEEIYKLYRMAEKKEFIALGTIFKIMDNWIINHILAEDKEYVEYYHKHQKKSISV